MSKECKCPKCGSRLKAIEHESLHIVACTYFTVHCTKCDYDMEGNDLPEDGIKELGITEIKYL